MGRHRLRVARASLLAHLRAWAPATQAPEESDGKLPINLDWYRDATKWLVTTSGAAVVFGFGLTAQASRGERGAFLVSSVFLLLSILGGILCHFWILSYANAYELLATSPDADTARRAEKTKSDAKEWIGVFYSVMIWPFFLGMAILVGYGGWKVVHPTREAPMARQIVAGGEGAVVVLYDPKTEQVQLLKRQPNGTYQWQRVPSP